MNAVLDYDTLEMLGAALRDERAPQLSAPLSSELASLCEQLGVEWRDEEPASTGAERRR